MQTYSHENHSRPDPVAVKLMGPQELIRHLVQHLEEHFYAVQTSDYRKNSRDHGVHIFLKVAGARE